MAVGFGWSLASRFSADLAEPFSQTAAAGFFEFSSFTFRTVMHVAGFLAGLFLIGFSIFTVIKNRARLLRTTNP
jgi:hypothetical protein